MTTAKKMIEVASSYIGTKGDHNVFNKWYWVDYTKTYSKDPGTAWCACFASYVAMKASLKCKYSASAAGFATQFERIPVAKEHTVKRGDIVVFNWNGRTDLSWCDHVGIVEWCTIGDNGLFGTIEGNTGNAAEGQVLRVTRDNNSSYFTAFFRPKYDAESASSTSTSTAAKTSTKILNGIDVSSNQPKDICSKVAYDFAIVKMSGNPQSYSWNYVNPYAAKQVGDAYKKTGCVGLYHFTWGKDANTEADFFVEQVKKLGYLKKAVLVIDYEAEAVTLGRAWVKKFADRVKAKTGCTPVIYASGSVVVAQKLFDLGYPIWCANYYKGYAAISGYTTSGCKIYSGCEKSVLWQFTSTGYLKGYGEPLDLNVFYGSKDDWKKLAGGSADIPSSSSSSTSASSSSSSTTSSSAKYIVTAQPSLNVRSKRSSLTGKVVGSLSNGSTVYLSDLKKNKYGNTWAKVASGTYKGKFVAVTFNGETLAKKAASKSVTDIAKEVIAGKWGNGQDRVNKLKAAGYDAAAVQKKVNELLS